MKEKIYIGVDLAIQLKWWQKILVWLGFRNKWSDYSCYTFGRKDENGVMHLEDMKYF